MINKSLLKILACPDCKSGLKESGKNLKCTNCKRIFKISNGIPSLLPKNQ
ncbi:hypothetical protein COS83_01525 [archaeon CG07_land_8_20_14_0_80_38_8]|nr:MAG: hypothetical protein COS83_01525 [archaeon CG07_land_8_20_14_0_80_38_8]PIU88714.1 MAG: hypothetical protein COS64_02830 [archaeon CG06_land_8_20_14_3_00_37_11]